MVEFFLSSLRKNQQSTLDPGFTEQAACGSVKSYIHLHLESLMECGRKKKGGYVSFVLELLYFIYGAKYVYLYSDNK